MKANFGSEIEHKPII